MFSPRTAQLGAVSAPVPAQRGSPRERGGEAGQRVLAVVWDVFHSVKIESELILSKVNRNNLKFAAAQALEKQP